MGAAPSAGEQWELQLQPQLKSEHPKWWWVFVTLKYQISLQSGSTHMRSSQSLHVDDVGQEDEVHDDEKHHQNIHRDGGADQ